MNRLGLSLFLTEKCHTGAQSACTFVGLLMVFVAQIPGSWKSDSTYNQHELSQYILLLNIIDLYKLINESVSALGRATITQSAMGWTRLCNVKNKNGPSHAKQLPGRSKKFRPVQVQYIFSGMSSLHTLEV